MATYSFLDVNCSITGVGGVIDLARNGASEEGVTITPVGDKNTMTIGADGTSMHSLLAGEPSSIKIRFLKTSPQNAKLMAMYNLQSISSIAHGKNTISLSNLQTGETVTATAVAFKKRPEMEYAREAKMVEWEFDCGNTIQILGLY